MIARRSLNLALSGGLFVALSAYGLCSDDVVAQAASRDGQRKAWLNSRNCGATTAFYNTLTVEVPEEWSAVEVMSGELCMWRSDDAALRWEGDDLFVTCKSCCPERMESKTEKVGRTTIHFEGFDVPPTK